MSDKLVLEAVAVARTTLVDGRPARLPVVSGGSCRVPAGGRLAIFGPSGSGKTSLLRLLNRLDEPSAGRLLLDGADLRTLDPIALRRRVGVVFQQPFLFDQTVEENLTYPLRLQRRVLPHARAAALLAEFGLDAALLSRCGDQLSGGQQYRVAVARALALAPEVLALDEPTAALDLDSAARLREALWRRNAAGLTLVVVTHDRALLRWLDSPVLWLHDGQVALLPDPAPLLTPEDAP